MAGFAVVFSIVDSVLLSYAAYIVAGRIASLAMSAFCGAAMAFFVMQPVFSFQIAEMRDAIALTCYGAGCLALPVVAKRTGAVDEEHADLSEKEGSAAPAPAYAPASVSQLIPEDLRIAIAARNISVAVECVRVPASREQTSGMLSDLLMAAIEDERVRRISIDGGQLPDVWLLSVTSHRVWPPPAGERITIGQHANKCTPLDFQGWPSHVRANWFDNGYARIYQVAVAREPGTESGISIRG